VSSNKEAEPVFFVVTEITLIHGEYTKRWKTLLIKFKRLIVPEIEFVLHDVGEEMKINKYDHQTYSLYYEK
jgi:hypothetical protein